MKGLRFSLEEFQLFFEEIVADINSGGGEVSEQKYLETVLRYNVPNASETRGFVVVNSYINLCTKQPTTENIRLACQLGWCFQILQTYILMMDEVFDDDISRWGKPTWFYHKNKHISVVNDAILLQNTAFSLLRKYFGTLPVYMQLVDYFTDISAHFFSGQCWEERATLKNDTEMVEYEIESFRKNIIRAHMVPFFLAPFQLSLLLSGKNKQQCKEWTLVENVCADITYFSRIKDDVNDAFGQNLNNPVNNSDIKRGSCKFAIVKAKELANSTQLEMLKRYYGKSDSESINCVKDIYERLGIPEICEKELQALKEKIEQKLTAMINDGLHVGSAIQQFMLWNESTNEY